MIPATSVKEEEVMNFHSDLQRPFLKKHQEVNIFLHRSFKISTEFTDLSSLVKNVEQPVEEEGEECLKDVSFLFEFRASLLIKPLLGQL